MIIITYSQLASSIAITAVKVVLTSIAGPFAARRITDYAIESTFPGARYRLRMSLQMFVTALTIIAGVLYFNFNVEAKVVFILVCSPSLHRAINRRKLFETIMEEGLDTIKHSRI